MQEYLQNTGPFTVLVSEAGSIATRTSDPFKNKGYRALQLTVVLANKAGAATVRPSLQRKMANGTWVTYWTAAAALSANGTVTYIITPNVLPTYTMTEAKIGPVPWENRVVLTFGGTTGAGNSYDTLAEAELVV